MVKIINALSKESEKGSFVLLELQGELELVQSQKTGGFYGTLRKCTLPCTMDLEVAKQFIGKDIPGIIVRQECTPYTFVEPETGEALEMVYRWSYLPDESIRKSLPHMLGQTVEM